MDFVEKKHLQNLINAKSDRLKFQDPTGVRSPVYEKFKIVFLNEEELEYAVCTQCCQAVVDEQEEGQHERSACSHLHQLGECDNLPEQDDQLP